MPSNQMPDEARMTDEQIDAQLRDAFEEMGTAESLVMRTLLRLNSDAQLDHAWAAFQKWEQALEPVLRELVEMGEATEMWLMTMGFDNQIDRDLHQKACATFRAALATARRALEE